jgi:tetratricopeptide (TPR) repeat protein
MKNKISIIIIFIFCFISISAQDLEMENAIKAYNNNDFDKAISIYKSILDKGKYSSALYYNLGNNYFKKDDYGNAMLFYEKALKFDPNQKDIQHNIYLTKRKIDSEIISLPDFFLNRWWQSLTNVFQTGVWTFLTYLFLILLVLSIGIYWFSLNEKLKNLSLVFIFVGAIFFIISLFAANSSNNRIYNNRSAILIKGDKIYIAPDSRSELMYDLFPGEKVILLDSLNEWYKVKLLNKEIGWVNKNNINNI